MAIIATIYSNSVLKDRKTKTRFDTLPTAENKKDGNSNGHLSYCDKQ